MAGGQLRRLVFPAVAVGIPVALAAASLEIGLRFTELVRNVGPAFTEYDPVYGKRLKRNLDCTRICPEFRMRITTNAEGFRGPPLQQAGRSGGIAFLGDSFTLGYGVDDGEEFPARVRTGLPAIAATWAASASVVNLGMGSNGNGRWLELIDRELPRFEPRVVVLQFCGNDYEENLREGLYRLDAGGALVEQPIPSESLARRVQRVIDRIPGLPYSYLLALVRERVVLARHRPLPSEAADAVTAAELAQRPEAQLTHAILGEAIDRLQRRGRRLLIVSVELTDVQRHAIAALAAERSVPVLFVPRRRERPDLYYRIDGHWNPDGHAWVAGRVLAWLRELRLQPEDAAEVSGRARPLP